jgi:hypothetical protein
MICRVAGGWPKKFNVQLFLKYIQARLRDPTFQFSLELKLKPKGKLVYMKSGRKQKQTREKMTDVKLIQK